MNSLFGAMSFQLGMTAGDWATPAAARSSPPKGVEMETNSFTQLLRKLSCARA